MKIHYFLSSIALVSLLGAGCGSDTPKSADQAEAPIVAPASNPPATETPKSEPVLQNNTYTITIENNTFSPATLSVRQGDSVVIVNNDIAKHSLTSDQANLFDTGLMEKGGKTTLPTSNLVRATYQYHCSAHPGMKGTLTVQ